jgi:phage gpG-like protein
MLLCVLFSGVLAASGEEQKVDKETYQEQTEGTLQGMAQKIEVMKSKAASLKMESKEKFDQEMEVLKKKKEAASMKLEKLKSATGETWGKLKAETDRAMEELTLQYNRVLSRFGGEQKMDTGMYQKQTEGALQGMVQNIEVMKSKAASLKMESKEKFDQEMEVLEKKKEAASIKLEKLKSATDETWGKLKAETDRAMEELTLQYNKMLSYFKNP